MAASKVIHLFFFILSFSSKDNITENTLLFKFSPFCGVSFSVEKKFDKWIDELPEEINLSYAKLNVITSRVLSREIAEELQIAHESPQLIWFDKEGNVKWHGSHHSITEDELNSNLIS